MAKAEKQAETRQFDDEHAPGSNGQLGTSCLLQSCSAEDVALLASQVWPQHSMQSSWGTLRQLLQCYQTLVPMKVPPALQQQPKQMLVL